MRIAIIDLGTNSVRFDVHQLGPGRKVRQLHREKIMVRLGQGVFLSGKLDRHAAQRTLHAFIRFKKTASNFKAEKVIAFGTSALREVSDRERFLNLIHSRTGIQVRVISGAEEAQLIALGILSQEKTGKGKFGLIDIGGGSTEINLCRSRTVLHSRSFPLGTARLQQVFLKKSPPTPQAVEELRQFIRGTLSGVMAAEHWPAVDRILGSSGTIRALAKILHGSNYDAFTLKELSDLVCEMARMTTTELLGISGMESKRVDMILAGAILLEQCMEMLGAKRAEITQYSLRDGILEEELRLFEQGGVSHLALHLPDLIEKAKRFGGEEAHLRRQMKLFDSLFDGLKPVHGLKPSWNLYLQAAMILRETGASINLSGYEEHSYYIVRNSDFPGAEPWEIELIAQLCRHHAGVKPDQKVASFTKNKSRQQAFLKFLGILRIADALDSGPESQLALKGVRAGRSGIRLLYGGRKLTGLEGIEVEKKAPLLRKILKIPIIAERVSSL